MRKIILAGVLAAVAIPSIATAQERNDRRENRQDMRQDQRRDVRHDRRELRQDRREFHRDRIAYVAPYTSWRSRTISPGARPQSSIFGARY